MTINAILTICMKASDWLRGFIIICHITLYGEWRWAIIFIILHSICNQGIFLINLTSSAPSQINAREPGAYGGIWGEGGGPKN